MSGDDFKYLWERDGAGEMEHPTIDRVDSDGNYEVDNCRFIERLENATRNQPEPSVVCRRGHEYTPDNTGTTALGGRYCRKCAHNRGKKYRMRKKAEAARKEGP